MQLRPGTKPLSSLVTALLSLKNDADLWPVTKARELLSELKLPTSECRYDGLQRSICLVPDVQHSPIIVFVDQFEEVYSPRNDVEERHIFINNLLIAASDPSKHVLVVLTLRSDFLREVQQDRLRSGMTLSELFSTQGFLVPAMTLENLRDAIVKPGERAGYRIEKATVALLIEHTKGREGALPLLQFSLEKIWAGLEIAKDPATTYQEIGGVGGALAMTAQDRYEMLTEVEKEVAQRIFIGLVQLGEGTRDTRRRVRVSSLIASSDMPKTVQRVTYHFSSSKARLLSIFNVNGDEVAEVTHEALFEHWQQLNEWLDSSRDDVRFKRRLESAAQYWDESNRPAGLLWQHPDLDLLHNYHKQFNQQMTVLELSFFKAAARRKALQSLIQWLGVSALAVLAVGATWLAVKSRLSEERALAHQFAGVV